jgi:hypothetical protein
MFFVIFRNISSECWDSTLKQVKHGCLRVLHITYNHLLISHHNSTTETGPLNALTFNFGGYGSACIQLKFKV